MEYRLNVRDNSDWKKKDDKTDKVEVKDVYKCVQAVFEYYYRLYEQFPRWVKETLGGDCYKNIKYLMDGVIYLYFGRNKRDDVNFLGAMYIELKKFEFGLRELKNTKNVKKKRYDNLSVLVSDLGRTLKSRINMLKEQKKTDELGIEK